jgi:hypothetical protein
LTAISSIASLAAAASLICPAPLILLSVVHHRLRAIAISANFLGDLLILANFWMLDLLSFVGMILHLVRRNSFCSIRDDLTA